MVIAGALWTVLPLLTEDRWLVSPCFSQTPVFGMRIGEDKARVAGVTRQERTSFGRSQMPQSPSKPTLQVDVVSSHSLYGQPVCI